MLKFSGFADLTSCHDKRKQRYYTPLSKRNGHPEQKSFNSTRASSPSEKILFKSYQLFVDMMHWMGQQLQQREKNWPTETPGQPSCPRHEKKTDTEAGMLPGITRRHNIRSKFYWFSEFCNSQCLSHFAAPFIVAWAETSVAESC